MYLCAIFLLFYFMLYLIRCRNLMKKLPIPPYLAKVLKEKVGADIIKIGGWDLSEVEAEFGQNLLNS